MIENILNKLEEASQLLDYINNLKEENKILQENLNEVRKSYKNLN